MPPAGRAYVLIVNFRRWRDTIECLESVLRSTGIEFRVVVCENGSGDGSWERLLEWAEGELDPVPSVTGMARFSQPALQKPIDYRVLDDDEAAANAPAPAALTLIRGNANRGFAGGTNLCLRHARRDPSARWFWLLNNDTVVEPDAMARLVEQIEAQPEWGMCGSTVLFYHSPRTIQAMGGGRYNPWLGTVSHVGEGKPLGTGHEEHPFYALGASLLASSRFVDEVGELNEDYFLYFEELDWAARGAGKFRVGWAPRSLVYHKEGSATGNARARPDERPAFADYCGIRSRLLFTRRFYPWALPTVSLGVIFAILNRARRGQWDRISGMLRLLLTAGGARRHIPAWMEARR